MNSITVLALVKAPPALIAPSGDKQLASFPVEVCAYKQEDPVMPLQVTAWGELAVEAMQTIQSGAYLVLTGRLRIEKNKPLELQIVQFHQVSTPLDRPGVNVAAIVGRAGRDPEARYFESGSMVANLTLAVNRRSREDEPDWFNLEIWGKQGQIAADYVRRGSLLGITGSLKLDHWTDRATGEARFKPVVKVDRLDLMGRKQDDDSFAQAIGQQPAPEDDDDLPF